MKKLIFQPFFLIFVSVILFCHLTPKSLAVSFDLSGQISARYDLKHSNSNWQNALGLRYLSEVQVKLFSDDSPFDAEMMLNNFIFSGENAETDSDVKIYRLKLRYAATQAEFRLGLQKINFGPAQLLRSLMWFDRVNPTDPLRMTHGVWGARFRYFFLNNTNIWAWCLYGNDEPKGMETFPSNEEIPEWGGRLQFPVPHGEIGLTYHTRAVKPETVNSNNFREDRYALDGRWDLGIGLWFESTVQQQHEVYLPYQWRHMITVGADFTFGLGNGLYAVAEYNGTFLSDEMLTVEDEYRFIACSFSYPVSIFDSFSIFSFYHLREESLYVYLNWQRTYDRWVINPGIYWYPETATYSQFASSGNAGGGFGAQLMIIFNH
ncbi:hypothetical protein CEE37_05660 [candidate division LCP-89 bacterium B3_LCP]|uniref:Porin n=1 Tax=candidate division LCP-89 bacterium B3_LCP TaxID=2012998 RepID=A0A532V1Q9_UNCL8|nr:MAG: hypothetical protein CEE37_05660 [candidate division LCP-89 bacterium B3_LCP]